jgi:hypothetical protein
MAGLLVVTACDAAHYPLAEDLVASLRATGEQGFRIGFIQMGDVPPPAELVDAVDEVRIAAGDGEEHREGEGFLAAKLAIKPRIPEFFPGYETYIWMDGDTWVQDAAGLRQIAHQARDADISIHPQLDPAYWQCEFPDEHTLTVYKQLFGGDIQARYMRRPMVNAGVFGARADSPLWSLWRDLLFEVRERLSDQPHRYFSDQIPMHYLIYSRNLRIAPLRAVNNWLAHHAAPQLHIHTGKLITPTYPHEKINIIHLVGPSKDRELRYQEMVTTLRYRDMRAHFGHLWGG